jgi:predicted DNA-binding protein (MmcQ/YjbR family)
MARSERAARVERARPERATRVEGVLTTPDEQTLKRLRSLCLSLPETSEKGSWGHPNFRAGKKTFVAFERVKGRASIAFRLNPDHVERLLRRKRFFVTPYSRGLWVSVWADGRVDWRLVSDLVERSYRVVALERMLRGLETET